MLLKILGALDILVALVLFLLKYGMPNWAAWAAVVYVCAKAFLAIKSIASIGDIIGAALIVLAIFGHFNILTYIAVIWFLQKGVASFF